MVSIRICIISLLGFACSLFSVDATISITIPAEKPSRPANFNWQFTSANGKPVQVGQFACGSYWVAPAAGDSAVTFDALTGSIEWSDLLSCDVDPITESHGLLSGKNNYGTYNAEENVLPKLPLTFKAEKGSCISLVAAMQRDEAATSPGGTKQIVGEVVDAYCVVTVLESAPKNAGLDMIRPNITGTSKELLSWDDFDLSRIPALDFLNGRSADDWENTRRAWSHSTEIFGMAVEKKTEKWGTTFLKASEGGRAFRSHLLVPDYGSGTGRVFNDAVLAMCAADSTLDDKKSALAAMIAYGLDVYHARYDTGEHGRVQWSSGAGQSLGAFVPPVFAVSLLKDESKAHRMRLSAITNHGEDKGELGPQELRQITRGVTGVLLWGDGIPIHRKENKMSELDWRYWSGLTASKCYDNYVGKQKPNSSMGQKTAADVYGYIDGPCNKPGSAYMSVSLGGFRSIAAIMIIMPAFRSVVNSDAPIEYADRVTRHGLWTWPDPVAIPEAKDQDTAKTWWSAEGAEAWGKTWGPRLDDVRFAIEDGKGRFKSLHGLHLKGGYESGQALSQWDKIIAMYDGERFEMNAVELGEVVAPDIFFATGKKPCAYLFCSTLGAQIHYTLDGSEPTSSSPVYEGKPIAVKSDTQLRSFALVSGKKPSRIKSKTVPPPL